MTDSLEQNNPDADTVVRKVCAASYASLFRRVDCWPAPEVSKNVNHTELGNLGLTSEEEDDIVGFLKTLSDGYSHRRSCLDGEPFPEAVQEVEP